MEKIMEETNGEMDRKGTERDGDMRIYEGEEK